MSHIHIGLCNLSFIIFVIPFYWLKYSSAIAFIHFFLFVASWFFILITEFTDPGIILRTFSLYFLGNASEEKPPDPNPTNLSTELPLTATNSETKLKEKKASIYM